MLVLFSFSFFFFITSTSNWTYRYHFFFLNLDDMWKGSSGNVESSLPHWDEILTGDKRNRNGYKFLHLQTFSPAFSVVKTDSNIFSYWHQSVVPYIMTNPGRNLCVCVLNDNTVFHSHFYFPFWNAAFNYFTGEPLNWI